MEFYERSLEEYNMDGWQMGGGSMAVMSCCENSDRAKKSSICLSLRCRRYHVGMCVLVLVEGWRSVELLIEAMTSIS